MSDPLVLIQNLGAATLPLSASDLMIVSQGGIARRTPVIGNGPWFNVQSYGAKGDGSDDAAAIQKAIDAAPDGSTIWFPVPANFYGIGASGIQIKNRNGLTLLGPGPCVLISSQSGPLFGSFNCSAAINVVTCSDVLIDGLVMNGHGLGMQIGFTNCTRGGAVNCRAYAGVTPVSGPAQISSIGGVNQKFVANHCYSAASASGHTHGIQVGHLNTGEADANATIEANFVYGNSSDGIQYCGTGGRIVANSVHDNLQSGINASSSAGGTISADVTIAANICYNHSGGHGIQSDAADGTYNLRFNVIGNTCHDNTTGIYLGHTKNWTITGNDVYNNVSAGIYVPDYAQGVSLTGNQCFDTRAGGARTQVDGILVTSSTVSTVFDISITGGSCTNNTTYGLQVTATGGTSTVARVAIAGGIYNSNGARGISLDEATAGNVTGSCVGTTCLNNTTYDIQVNVRDVLLDSNTYSLYNSGTEYYTLATGATPTVGFQSSYKFANTGATNVTALNGGFNGMQATFFSLNGNTTLKEGASIIMKGATDATIPANGIITLKLLDTVWYEVSRSF